MMPRHKAVTAAIWPRRKIRIIVIVAGIGDLDADRARIDVGFVGPETLAGMPCAQCLRHALHDVAVLEHVIMRGDFARGVAHPFQRALRLGHPGIMKQDHIGNALARAVAVVGREHDLAGEGGVGIIGREGHAPVHAKKFDQC
jgi:hypothetical protein